MHSHVKLGNKLHKDHFDSIRHGNHYLAPGWKVIAINGQIKIGDLKGSPKLRPDWAIINEAEKRGFIIDLTTKYNPTHFQKGMQYVNEVRRIVNDPSWNVVYLEDYWLDPNKPNTVFLH